ALALFPILILIINTTRDRYALQGSFSMIPGVSFAENFEHTVFGDNDPNSMFNTVKVPIIRGMLNSLLVAGSSCLLTTYFSAMTAYGIHVYDFKGKKFLFNFILVIMMIPTQVSSVGFVSLVENMKMMDTYWPLIIPAIAAPSVFFYMKQYLESSFPIEVVEAARVDGCSEFRTFNTISLPILKPAIAVQLIFAFVASWNNFFTPSLILRTKDEMKTVPILISKLSASVQSGGADYGQVYMTIFLSIIPVVIIYFFVSKNIVEGVALGAVKG
ncbi:MAG: carbohydrate ABC transporter permease, partial [Oscillospiraceae bacterium]